MEKKKKSIHHLAPHEVSRRLTVDEKNTLRFFVGRQEKPCTIWYNYMFTEGLLSIQENPFTKWFSSQIEAGAYQILRGILDRRE